MKMFAFMLEYYCEGLTCNRNLSFTRSENMCIKYQHLCTTKLLNKIVVMDCWTMKSSTGFAWYLFSKSNCICDMYNVCWYYMYVMDNCVWCFKLANARRRGVMVPRDFPRLYLFIPLSINTKYRHDWENILPEELVV